MKIGRVKEEKVKTQAVIEREKSYDVMDNLSCQHT